MRTLKLDSDNNIQFDSNFILLDDKKGNEALVQDIKNLLSMFQTEYPFNTTKGIPYYDLASQNNRQLIENTIIERLREDSRVKGVSNLKIEFKNGIMTMSCDLKTENGVLNV